jgi:mRNA interferase MazF
MARFIKGEVVVLPFHFSDLSQAKRRSALVIAELEGNDVILCQITSLEIMDRYVISINDNDFESGGLRKPINVRPNRIFTADRYIVLYGIGFLKKEKISEVIENVVKIIRE